MSHVKEGKLKLYDFYSNQPYKIAAQIIHDHVFSTGYNFNVSEDTISILYKNFYKKFSPEVLSKIPNDDLLETVFYTSKNTNDSLCYWLEFHDQYKELFGNIASNFSYKFGLYQRKADNAWITGAPTQPEVLSEEDAIKLGHEICNSIIKGAEIIDSANSLNTVGDYEKLDDDLNKAMGKYAHFAWIHKYYCMIFPSKLVTWHSDGWRNHMLYAYGIKPSDKYYGRSGQLSIIANYAQMSAPFFTHASYDRFGDIKQFCRIGTTDENGNKKYFPTWKDEKIVAIGWNDLGSLENYIQAKDNIIDKKAITDKFNDIYYPSDARTSSRKASELKTFYETSDETIFVAADGATLLAFGDTVGSYFYDSSKIFAHCKPVTWYNCFSDKNILPHKTEALRTSCYTISDSDNLLFLYNQYYYILNKLNTDKQHKYYYTMDNTKTIKRNPRIDIMYPLNQIMYGAPGTGKTYLSIEYAMAIIEDREIDNLYKIQENRKTLMEKYESCVQNGQIIFTTFHQSYSYEEFIQGIRPDSNSGTINFKKVDGIFKNIADRALTDTENNYVIIIDEINRGNISKIFGELITLIEDDKRFGELNQLTVTLPLGDNFTVPNNLYIIGTMNSADKSISFIDTALRRRFSFIEMSPNESIIKDNTLRTVLTTLNTYLKEEFHSTDLLIGHSFFIGKSVAYLDDIMNYNIIPLLYEYFYDNETKIKKALDCLNNTGYKIDSDYKGRIRVKKV